MSPVLVFFARRRRMLAVVSYFASRLHRLAGGYTGTDLKAVGATRCSHSLMSVGSLVSLRRYTIYLVY